MKNKILFIFGFFLEILVISVISVPCPPKCLCFRTTVRCMFLQLEKVPHVPPETTILDLRFNKIRDITPNSFKELHQLNTLLLNNNHIVRLRNGVFNGLRELRYLYLYKNRIREIENKVFQGLPKLEQLYLHFNDMDTFDPETFSNMPSVDRLFLHNNRLEKIPSGAFKNMESLRRLRLDSNALVCDCHLLWLARMLKEKQGSTQAAATCQSPPSLLGRPIAALTETEFHCRKPEITEEPADVEVTFGGTVYFSCKADGDPSPDIVWLRNSNEISSVLDPRYSILGDGTLMIENTDDSDMGVYECMAKNPAGEARSRSAKMSSPKGKAKPRFTSSPKDIDKMLGETFTMECAASGLPRPDVSWTKDDVPINQSDRYHVSVDGSFTIRDAKRRDTGIYRCSAANYLGRVTAIAHIKILVAPILRETPKEQTARVGGTVDFLCMADGSPLPIISWTKNGEIISPEGRITISVGGTQLHIKNVKPSDDGTYACRAQNSVGFQESSAVLIVRERIPPQLVRRPQDTEALQGASVEMPCQAQGEPEPIIIWKKDGEAMEENARHHRVTPDGSLYVYNVSKTDEGMYECSALNDNGYSIARGHLTIKDEALPPGPSPTPNSTQQIVIEEAVEEARRAIDRALNDTVRALYQRDRLNRPPSPSDLLRLVRFPNNAGREVARAAEIYERALHIVQTHIEAGMKFNLTDFKYEDILSPSQLQLIANLSGCLTHRAHVSCSDMCFHSKYRSIDGSCNNLQHSMWGASLTAFKRLLRPIYENGFNTPVGWSQSHLYHSHPKPSARLISSRLISTKTVSPDEECTHMLMQWGQFLDHDLDHAIPSISKSSFADGIDCSRSCAFTSPCFPIEIPPNDPRVHHHRCMEFTRSSAICGSGMTSVFFESVQPREQINQLTAFIDASQVYGSSEEETKILRDFSFNNGLLREGIRGPTGKSLMPFSENHHVDCRRDPRESSIGCFLGGDIRANEQVGLLAMHQIWFREHNRIATELHELNSQWDSDTLFQESRKIVGAEFQHITYNHWLPYIIGPKGMQAMGAYKGYDPNVDPRVANSFATAVLRFGHTLINPILHRLNSSFQTIPEGPLPLHKAFFSPWRLVEEGGIDPLLRGLFAIPTKLKRHDEILNTELTEQLFKMAHVVALDLAAINIQRGRDHALPSYNEWRKFCNLSEASTFDDLSQEIINDGLREKLQQLYGHPGNIDLWVGGVLEDVEEGARVGPTFRCLLTDQFKRLRDGDRFWYENPGVFKPSQLTQIKQSTLSRVICDNGDNITDITHNVFILPQKQTPAFSSCTTIPKVDLRMWVECCEECQRNRDRYSTFSINRIRRSPQQSYPEDRPLESNEYDDNYGQNASSIRHKLPVGVRNQSKPDLFEQDNSERKRQIMDSDYDLENLNNERIEGIESLLESFQKELKQLKRKVRRLEEHCGMKREERKKKNTCVDESGRNRGHGEVWQEGNCSECFCQNKEVSCITVKCPVTTCSNPVTPQDKCCPVCL